VSGSLFLFLSVKYNTVFGCVIYIYKLFCFLVPSTANMRKSESDNGGDKQKKKAVPINSVPCVRTTVTEIKCRYCTELHFLHYFISYMLLIFLSS
jgi:hypothetical protein